MNHEELILEEKRRNQEFTPKTNAALAAAFEVTQINGHARFTPLHLAIALISEPPGLFRQLILNATGNSRSCKRQWTAGATLRNVPVGGATRKNKRQKTTHNKESSVSASDSSVNVCS